VHILVLIACCPIIYLNILNLAALFLEFVSSFPTLITTKHAHSSVLILTRHIFMFNIGCSASTIPLGLGLAV
jgi:hypothetical protein